ncbi:MAG: hypothetical protein K6C34_00125 [Alphaproteobacteria bacterium]|nr:hypothetical protein [Alphaproteobacteria bacterium]
MKHSLYLLIVLALLFDNTYAKRRLVRISYFAEHTQKTPLKTPEDEVLEAMTSPQDERWAPSDGLNVGIEEEKEWHQPGGADGMAQQSLMLALMFCHVFPKWQFTEYLRDKDLEKSMRWVSLLKWGDNFCQFKLL